MQRVLFHSTIFGPVHSRRLGVSLGVNLGPNDGKVCSFDCLYCEAGYNEQGPGTTGLPLAEDVREQLRERLSAMKESGEKLDVITFSGNGEPTMHPDFAQVIDDTVALRDQYFPDVKISVLSNATCISRQGVAEALSRVDNNVLKLDSAIDSTMRALDRPLSPTYSVAKAIDGISRFKGSAIVQTMLTRGVHDGVTVDNTTPAEIDALVEAYRRIAPREVMLYSIDRQTPEHSLVKVSRDELEAVAERVRKLGIAVQVV